jgi:hypothetical protein
MKKRRWLWWWGTIAGLLLIAVVVFHAVLTPVAARVAGSLLGVKVSIGKVDLAIFGDSLVVENLRVAQPKGFGDQPMIELGHFSVEGWHGALFHPRRIKQVRVERVRLELVSKADGTSNLATLLGSTNSDKAPAAPAVESAKSKEAAPAAKEEAFGLLVDRIAVSSVSVVRRNQLEDGKEHRLELLSDQLTVNRLAIGEVADIEPGDIEFTGGIVQPGLARAEIYLGGRFSKLGTGAENLRVGARVTGCLFDTFVPIIPSNTGDILGGKGFDLDVDIKTAGGLIDVQGGMVTPNESTYAFAVSGRVDAPEVKLPKKLMAVTSRMAGGAGRLFRSVVGGSGELLEGTAKTVGAFGKGLFSAAGNVLKGAGQTTVGVVTADTAKIKSGAGTATVDAGGSVVHAVDDSAKEIADTGGNTAGALGNDPATQKWMAAIPARHGKRIDGLLTGIRAEDFPPKIKAPAGTDQK